MKNSKKKKRDTFPSRNVQTAPQIKDDLLSCGHYLTEHIRMHEAKASAELAHGHGSTKKSICELIDMSNADIRNKKR